MNDLKRLEKEVMDLPDEDREHLVFLAWESLEKTPVHDAEGIEIALTRDREIESGTTKPINHSEFIRRTSSKG